MSIFFKHKKILEGELGDAKYDQSARGKRNRSFIGLDEQNKKVRFINTEMKPHSATYDYADILEAHVVEDGESITKTSRGSQVAGAAVGGVLLGGAGLLLGGLSGKKKHKETVRKIELAVVVNDTANPVRRIAFLDDGIDLEKRSAMYKKAREKADYWHRLLDVVIKQSEQNEGSSGGIADLEKLAELRDKGVITDADFEAKKKQILGL